MIWSNKIKSYFENKGYIYTKHLDEFYVDVSDLNAGCSKKVRVLCDYCKKEYFSPYNMHLKRYNAGMPDLCRSCSNKRQQLKRKDATYLKLKSKCEFNGYTLLTDREDYFGTRSYVKFICNKHGEQVMLADNIINGHKCIKCSYENRGKQCRYDVNTVEQKINAVNGNKLLNKSDYINSTYKNLKVLCGICGTNTFITSLDDYFNHNTNRCRKCSKSESVGELLISKVLDEYNIVYERQKKFSDCTFKRQLPFDFYLTEYNTLIEFDGQQHYNPIYGNNTLMQVQERDCIKDNYCKTKNIKLIRIPYWDRDNIEKIIVNNLEIV